MIQYENIMDTMEDNNPTDYNAMQQVSGHVAKVVKSDYFYEEMDGQWITDMGLFVAQIGQTGTDSPFLKIYHGMHCHPMQGMIGEIILRDGDKCLMVFYPEHNPFILMTTNGWAVMNIEGLKFAYHEEIAQASTGYREVEELREDWQRRCQNDDADFYENTDKLRT
jgi:hypothetical protein